MLKSVKKLIFVTVNLVVIALAAYLGYLKFEDYFANPWTRNGQVRAQVIQVAPRVTGMVVHIGVIDNQFVNAADLLFRIDPEPFVIRIAQAESDLERQKISSRGAKIEFDRVREIYGKDPGAISEKDLNRREVNYLQSLSRIEVAEEQLKAAKLDLQFTNVHASVDGFVSNINFQIGSQAVANQPILALVDSNSFWVFGYFRENQLNQFKIGDKAKVTLMAYPDRPLDGTVESIGWGIAPQDGNAGANLLPSINPVFQWIRLAQRMPVRVILDRPPKGVELRVGMTASVMITPQ